MSVIAPTLIEYLKEYEIVEIKCRKNLEFECMKYDEMDDTDDGKKVKIPYQIDGGTGKLQW